MFKRIAIIVSLSIALLVGSLFPEVLSDFANNQLPLWERANGKNPPKATDTRGAKIPSLTASLAVSNSGPLLLQDTVLIDNLAHFVRSKPPPRVVHAKGFAVSGYFETKYDITKYTKAEPFQKIDQKTPVTVRFSTSMGGWGASDLERDARGFAVKFFTQDGNWDLPGLSLPVFPIWDPMLFPSLNQRHRNARTGFYDLNSEWDFLSLRTESTLFTMLTFSDEGIPDGYRHMNGYGVHAFKMVNSKDEIVYCKFHFRTNQGEKYLRSQNATILASKDPDYSARDLYNAIESENYPSWNMELQIMNLEQAEKNPASAFDATKLWKFNEFKRIPVGTLVLNKNPDNFFQESEQIGFTPSNLIPGIEASPDRLLQGRMFAYGDALRYRLGTNWNELTANKPKVPVHTYMKDGLGSGVNDSSPSYYPNSFGGPMVEETPDTNFTVSGEVGRFDLDKDDNHSQPKWLWTTMDEGQRRRMVINIANSLKYATKIVRDRVIKEMFEPVHPDFVNMLNSALRKLILKKNSE